MPEITNFEQLEEWLKRKPKDASIAIAARSALRVIPELTTGYVQNPIVSAKTILALFCLRAALTSSVACKYPTDAVKRASARSARSLRRSVAFSTASSSVRAVISAAEAIANSPSNPTISATVAVDAATNALFSATNHSPHSAAVVADHSAARATVRAATFFDAETWSAHKSGEFLFHTPLWPAGSQINAIIEAKQTFDLAAQTDNSVWDFWARWYQGMWDGKPLNWDLQRRVALIDDAIWKAGPEAVAEEITEIKREFLREQLPLAEDIVFNEDTGKFRVEPKEPAKPDLFATSLSQVEDYLDDVLASPSNGLTERSREARVLRRCFTRYGNDPQRIEMDFVSVHSGLARQLLVTEELPQSEENLALLGALEDGARSIRAAHPEIAENRESTRTRAFNEMNEVQKTQLSAALPLLAKISDTRLAEGFTEDIAFLTTPDQFSMPTL